MAVPTAVKMFQRSAPSPDGGPSNHQSNGSPFSPKSHRVYYGHVVDSSGQVLDEVLLLHMRKPRSYTREDVVELHCHGGGICAQRILEECLQLGCRLAAPGEFTLRAFLHGRLDLSQAESVAQLVTARTSSAADSALAGLQVCLSDLPQQVYISHHI
jgi:tRNA modification GTPase